MLQIRIKKLVPEAVVPTYAKEGDAGMDLTCTSIENTKDYVEYGTGIAVEIPYGYVGLLFPRSSNSKKDLVLCNSVGVVDAGYRGEIKFRYKFIAMPIDFGLDDLDYHGYEIGDRVGQIVIMPFPEVGFIESDELSDSVRGADGYGSSGA